MLKRKKQKEEITPTPFNQKCEKTNNSLEHLSVFSTTYVNKNERVPLFSKKEISPQQTILPQTNFNQKQNFNNNSFNVENGLKSNNNIESENSNHDFFVLHTQTDSSFQDNDFSSNEGSPKIHLDPQFVEREDENSFDEEFSFLNSKYFKETEEEQGFVIESWHDHLVPTVEDEGIHKNRIKGMQFSTDNCLDESFNEQEESIALNLKIPKNEQLESKIIKAESQSEIVSAEEVSNIINSYIEENDDYLKNSVQAKFEREKDEISASKDFYSAELVESFQEISTNDSEADDHLRNSENFTVTAATTGGEEEISFSLPPAESANEFEQEFLIEKNIETEEHATSNLREEKISDENEQLARQQEAEQQLASLNAQLAEDDDDFEIEDFTAKKELEHDVAFIDDEDNPAEKQAKAHLAAIAEKEKKEEKLAQLKPAHRQLLDPQSREQRSFADELADEDIHQATATQVFEEIKINDDYIIPTDFLTLTPAIDESSWREEITKNSKILVNTLNNFGIGAKVVKVNRGPVITLYEIQIAAGIRVSKITTLSDDIAMALAASRVRIVAPIPGKSAIGVEIPNTIRAGVSLGDIVKSVEFQKAKGALKVGLGKDILGKPLALDLKKQPHLLIAGATGSGKSVCVNTLICSLIYNYDPNYVRFIMVDPKMVELQLYNGIPHQLTPVITEPHVAPKALKWAVYEMERRYKLLSDEQTRDIDKYNEKIKYYTEEKEHLPYIVIIVDELADLMMAAPKETESYIARIAQKARAVGIHLVLATQRPSVDIITGIIKANFPARIAFQVAQKTDSRTIMDQNGAEKLLGKGDMLYISPASSFPTRIQGCFIAEEEVIRIVGHARKFGKPRYIDIEGAVAENDLLFEEENDEEDELFVEAIKIIEQTQKASASFLQRKLSIGYNRAARMIERMEELGYVGPPNGSKPREVYV